MASAARLTDSHLSLPVWSSDKCLNNVARPPCDFYTKKKKKIIYTTNE